MLVFMHFSHVSRLSPVIFRKRFQSQPFCNKPITPTPFSINDFRSVGVFCPSAKTKQQSFDCRFAHIYAYCLFILILRMVLLPGRPAPHSDGRLRRSAGLRIARLTCIRALGNRSCIPLLLGCSSRLGRLCRLCCLVYIFLVGLP